MNKIHNFLFHPLHPSHRLPIKILSIVTQVALAILTCFTSLIAFIIVNLRDRKIQQLQKNQKDISLDNNPQIQNNNNDNKKHFSNLTATLLSNKYGFSPEPNDYFRPGIGFIGDTQGHKNFRQEVAKIGIDEMHALSPQALRENRAINPQTSLILTAKRLGHALALRGDIILEDNTCVNLEGFSEVFTIPMLADSFDMFAKENPNLVSQEQAKWILEHFMQSTRSDGLSEEDIAEQIKNLKNPNFEGPFCVSTGYDWHSTFLIFFREFVFAMNRGNDPFELKIEDQHPINEFSGPGVTMFRTRKPFFNITDETASKMFKRMNYRYPERLQVDQLIEELKLLFLDNKRAKNQKSGNCTYASTKLAILTLLALYSVKDEENITIEKLDLAFADAKKIYKKWVDFDRNYVVKDLIEEVRSLKASEDENSYVYKAISQLLAHARKKSFKLNPEVIEELSMSSIN